VGEKYICIYLELQKISNLLSESEALKISQVDKSRYEWENSKFGRQYRL
jgi:hypothetical protein